MSGLVRFNRFIGAKQTDAYWGRVHRNLPYYGASVREQKAVQERLRGAVVGISGLAGAGGGVAIRLAQLGVGKLKLADDRIVTSLSLARQLGAEVGDIGSPISDTVARAVQRIAPDVEIDSFPGGVSPESAETFVSGCDLIIDQTRHGDWLGKVALHQAFRKQKRAEYIISCSSIGWVAILYKFSRTGTSLEDWLGVSGNEELTVDMLSNLLDLVHPHSDNLPSAKEIGEWAAQHAMLPLLSSTASIAEGLLVTRAILIVTKREGVDGFEMLPEVPTLYYYDASSFSSHYLDT